MRQILLEVETLGFEAHEDDVVENLLSTPGVLEARFDVIAETIDITLDPERVGDGQLADILRFFGLTVKAS